MLLPCPECGQRISDRAAACPGCGFPIAEHLTSMREAEAKERDRKTREEVGEADCPHCEARGFVTASHVDEDGKKVSTFGWCTHCEHSGRVALVRSERGYWAVAYDCVAAFVAGDIDEQEGVWFLGTEMPAGHRYQHKGAPGVPASTPFTALADDFLCPDCGTGKSSFRPYLAEI